MRQDFTPERLHPRIFSDSLVSRSAHGRGGEVGKIGQPVELDNSRTSIPLPGYIADHGTFYWNHSEPTVFENYVHDIFIDNVHVELSLWDTAGQEEFDRLRSLSYDDTHAIMLCFSVDSPDSLENVESKWVGEITENCPGVRLVLVALKCDLREQQREEEEEGTPADPKRPMIDYKAGLAVAEKIKALRYLGASGT